MAYEDFEDYSEKVKDTDYYNVIIPDLDPGTNIPVQFRWQYLDKTFGGWSAGKMLEVPKLERPESTNVVAVWEGTSLKITWSKPSNLANGFQIYLTNGTTTSSWTKSVDKTQDTQTFILGFEDNKANFGGIFRTSFTGFIKTTYIDNTTTGTSFTTPVYQDAVCSLVIADTDWDTASIANGFTVSWKTNLVSYPTYRYTEVWVSSSTNGTYSKEYSGSGPATIKVSTVSANYVKIKHFSASECSTSFSVVKSVSAYDPVVTDTLPPVNDFTLGNATVSDDSNGLFTFDKKVLFTWTENTSSDTAGYRIRFRLYGTTDPYTYMSVPGKTKLSTYIYGLKGGKTYEIGVSTFDSYDNTNETQWLTYSSIVVPVSNSLVPDAAITAGDMKMGYGLGPSSAYKGLYLGPENYWYIQGNSVESSAARISVGGTDDKLIWDGTSLTATGRINANSGTFTGTVNIGTNTTNGQLSLYAGSNRFEIGRLKNTSGAWINEIGIQGTNSSGTIFQLDTANGVLVNQGSIGGWAITASAITKNQTSLGSDGSITAGSSGQFSVTTSGALTATDATIKGTVRASGGGFGTFTGNTLSKGWNINPATLTSTGYAAGTSVITLDGENGTISGGLISGTKIIGGQLGVTGNPGALGATVVTDVGLSETSDQNDGGSSSTVNGSGLNVTLTIQDGQITSDKTLKVAATNGTIELYSGGSLSAAFGTSSASINYTGSLYLGSQGSSAANQGHTGSSITVDGRMRLRYGAPLTYPNTSNAGAYIRNIYIKQTSVTSLPSTTGNVGDVYITY